MNFNMDLYEKSEAKEFGDYETLELGGHELVIMDAREYTSEQSGKTSLKVSVDIAGKDEQKGFFKKRYDEAKKTDANAKWSSVGVKYLSLSDEQILKYPLDLAEKAHIDTSDDSVLIIVDAPVIEYKDKQKNYTTMPLGMILVRDDIFITISQVKINSVMEMLNNTQNTNIETNKKSRYVFKI